MLVGAKSLAEVETLTARCAACSASGDDCRIPRCAVRCARSSRTFFESPLHALIKKAQRRMALESAELPFGVVSLGRQGIQHPRL